MIFFPHLMPATFHASALTTCFVFHVFHPIFGRSLRRSTGCIGAGATLALLLSAAHTGLRVGSIDGQINVMIDHPRCRHFSS
jgi:hypothetical protein